MVETPVKTSISKGKADTIAVKFSVSYIRVSSAKQADESKFGEYFDKEYRAGSSLITDKSFDQLEANLFRVNPNSDYFNRKNKLALPSLEKGN